VLQRYGVNGGQLIGMQFPDAGLHGRVAIVFGLEHDAEFLVMLKSALPSVEAFNLGDLSAGNQLSLDQSARNFARHVDAGDGRVDGDELHRLTAYASRHENVLSRGRQA